MKNQFGPEKPPRREKETSERWSFTSGLVSRLRDWRAWLNIVLLFLVLEIAVLSLERAGWLKSPFLLTPVLILAMLSVWLLARTRIPSYLLHILAPVIGAVITFGLAYDQLAAGGAAYFNVFLIYLVWLIGYISTWFLLRKQNAWVGVCLGALVILVNLSNLPKTYYYFFGLYFVAAAFLVVQNRLARQHLHLERGIKYTRRGLALFLASLLCLVVLAVTFSWAAPEARIPQLQTMIATRILWKQDIEKSSFNIFAAVPSKQPLVTSSMLQDLPFETTWHQGDRIDFIVSSERPSYWQVQVYDTYTPQGWTNRPAEEYLLDNGSARDGIEPGAEKLTYTVETGMKTNELLKTGDLISSSIPVMVHESAGDVISMTAPRLLGEGEKYTITAAVPRASPEELARADQNFPRDIRENYLQLPPDYSEKVRQLTSEIVKGAASPYEKVLAIRDYLAKIPYETEVEAPPEGTDGVEYFLLTQKSGFCVHYASAMAVMLRCAGVPSRVVVGYLPGDPGDKVGEYILRDKQYHAWPQVYFKGYGWVDIEVTPSGYVGAGSEVTLETPWVSSQTISALPQWDIWQMMAAYGIPMARGGTSGASAYVPPRTPPGPLPFADELGLALLVILIIAFGIIVLAMPLVLLRSAFYRWVWQVDRANIAVVTYEKLCRLGAMVRMGPRPQQTPMEYTAELTAAFPRQAKALDKIARSYVANRFGRRRERPSLFEEAEILKARCSVFEVFLMRLGLAGKLFRRQQ